MVLKKFAIEMEVRDNELDSQGIVNNNNYMIYLSHARHKHGGKIGVNHADYAKKGMNLVVTSCEMKFKNSLRADDVFEVTSVLSSSNLPFHWSHKQVIKRKSDGAVIMKAVFNATCVNNNPGIDVNEKLSIPEEIRTLIE